MHWWIIFKTIPEENSTTINCCQCPKWKLISGTVRRLLSKLISKKDQTILAHNFETYQPKKSVKILLKRPDYICFALGMFFIETGKMTFNPFVVPFAVEYVGKEVTIVFHLNSCVVIF